MIDKAERLLRVGVLGCGPIAQFAHLDACRKARNVELQAICDLALDLLERMAAVHGPPSVYRDYDAMLADPAVEAIVIGIADQYHVEMALKALDAGRPVLVEKPLGVTIEECERLRDRAAEAGLVVQVGNNRRFDPGVAYAARFAREEMGDLLALKAWYCDSTHRYTMTDNLQPIPVASASARRPAGDPKANRKRYYLLTHGSHLVDTARFAGGPIDAVRARLLHRDGAHCWFVEVAFASGAFGHLDLTVPIRGDFTEGFVVYGAEGSVECRTHLPWFHRASDVRCFSERDRTYRAPLGEDAHSYKRQAEGFADSVLNGAPLAGASVEDGLAAMRAMVAIARSVEAGDWVRLADVSGGV